MARVYRDKEEFMRSLKYVPVFDVGDPHVAVYSEGKKIGRFDKNNLELKTKVKLASPFAYTGDKPFTRENAVYHRLFGRGREISIPFAEIDDGITPEEFKAAGYGVYRDYVEAMYSTNGTKKIHCRQGRYVGGWTGTLTYSLRGEIRSNRKEWQFDGYIGIHNDPHDYDWKKFGEREDNEGKLWPELLTRVGGLIPGDDYDISFPGKRWVKESGKCFAKWEDRKKSK